MIKKFTDKWQSIEATARARFAAKHPDDYGEIVKTVVELLAGDDDEFGTLDPSRITEIDHGDYQGTLLFVIASNNYQPDTFWYVKVSYGSCSACDTLQAILGYGDPVTEQQAADYYVLATHIVQGLKEMP